MFVVGDMVAGDRAGLAAGSGAGFAAAVCCWRLAALMARGAALAATVAAVLAAGGVAWAVRFVASRDGGPVESLLLLAIVASLPATMGWSAWLVLRAPFARAEPFWPERSEWLRRRYRRRPLRLGLALLIVLPLFTLVMLILASLLVRLLRLPLEYSSGPAVTAGWVGIAMALMLVRRSRVRAMIPTPELTSDDPRPPVVYLRSFASDRVLIPAMPSRHPGYFELTDGDRIGAPLEEIVAATMWRYGPVLAAAEPGRRSPSIGAARAELPDVGWETTLLQWIGQAQMIVVALGRGPGLMWELERVVEHGLAHRVLFVVPEAPFSRARSWITRLKAIRDSRDRGVEENRAAWSALCDVLDQDRVMWLPRDLDLHGVRVVLPGCYARPGPAHVFVAKVAHDFSYEAALDAAVHRMLAGSAEGTGGGRHIESAT